MCFEVTWASRFSNLARLFLEPTTWVMLMSTCSLDPASYNACSLRFSWSWATASFLPSSSSSLDWVLSAMNSTHCEVLLLDDSAFNHGSNPNGSLSFNCTSTSAQGHLAFKWPNLSHLKQNSAILSYLNRIQRFDCVFLSRRNPLINGSSTFTLRNLLIQTPPLPVKSTSNTSPTRVLISSTFSFDIYSKGMPCTWTHRGILEKFIFSIDILCPFGLQLFLRLRFCPVFFSSSFFGSTCNSWLCQLWTVHPCTVHESHKLLFSNFFLIKNESHNTIYIFKNYFATVFSVSVFNFSKNKLNPNRPIVMPLFKDKRKTFNISSPSSRVLFLSPSQANLNRKIFSFRSTICTPLEVLHTFRIKFYLVN